MTAKPLVYRWRDLIGAGSDLTTTERAVGWRSSDYGDAKGQNIRPGSLRLARDLGLSTRPGDTRNQTIERALRRLCELGYLAQIGAGFRGHAAVYQLRFPTSERGTVQSPNPAGSETERGTPQCAKGDSTVPPPTHHQQPGSKRGAS